MEGKIEMMDDTSDGNQWISESQALSLKESK